LRCAGSDVDQIISIACGSPFNTLVVSPQSNVVACFEVVNDRHPLAQLATIGRITPEGVQIDEDARTYLRQKSMSGAPRAMTVFCYWSCAGDCLIRSFSPDPNNYLNHGVRCELNRTLLREMLLKRIAAGNGLWQRAQWGKPVPRRTVDRLPPVILVDILQSFADYHEAHTNTVECFHARCRIGEILYALDTTGATVNYL